MGNELEALAVRCERASAKDYKALGVLTTDIRRTLGLQPPNLPLWLISIDAATKLFPADTMYRSGHSALAPDPSMFFCDIVMEDGRDFHACAHTEAAARVAAALRARALTPRDPLPEPAQANMENDDAE